MKIIFSIKIIGLDNSGQVAKLYDLSCIPPHNSVAYLDSGPSRRLNDDISIDYSRFFTLRINNKNITYNISLDLCSVEADDDTQSNVSLHTLIKEYTDCGWRIVE